MSSTRSKETIVMVISWLIVVWICFIFLGSLPYKFTDHPDTIHIFSTIGQWMNGILGTTIGTLFTRFGAYATGLAELVTCIVLISPILYLRKKNRDGESAFRSIRARMHTIGGGMASLIMAGAVFFHLFTPLGIEVLHQGQSDGGSLFRAAVSILVLGIVMVFINKPLGFKSEIR